jgi:hypothetical protein
VLLFVVYVALQRILQLIFLLVRSDKIKHLRGESSVRLLSPVPSAVCEKAAALDEVRNTLGRFNRLQPVRTP